MRCSITLSRRLLNNLYILLSKFIKLYFINTKLLVTN
jgi:hypothetical protein